MQRLLSETKRWQNSQINHPSKIPVEGGTGGMFEVSSFALAGILKSHPACKGKSEKPRDNACAWALPSPGRASSGAVIPPARAESFRAPLRRGERVGSAYPPGRARCGVSAKQCQSWKS